MNVDVSMPDPYVLPQFEMFGLGNILIGPWNDPAGLTQKAPGITGGQNTVLLIALGQSLIANHDNDSYTPSNSLAHQFCYTNGGVYSLPASGPNMGGSWLPSSPNKMTYLTRIADKLITDGYCARTITANVAVGSTSSNNWKPGGNCNVLLSILCRRLWAGGYIPANLYRTFIIWHEGESQDCLTLGITAAQYAANVTAALNTIFNYVAPDASVPFANAKAFVQIATQGGGGIDVLTQGGQTLVPNGANIFQGYNLDANIDNSLTNRYDHLHLASPGCATAANGTAAILETH